MWPPARRGHRGPRPGGKAGKKEVEKVSRAQSAWGIGLKADVGR